MWRLEIKYAYEDNYFNVSTADGAVHFALINSSGFYSKVMLKIVSGQQHSQPRNGYNHWEGILEMIVRSCPE